LNVRGHKELILLASVSPPSLAPHNSTAATSRTKSKTTRIRSRCRRWCLGGSFGTWSILWHVDYWTIGLLDHWTQTRTWPVHCSRPLISAACNCFLVKVNFWSAPAEIGNGSRETETCCWPRSLHPLNPDSLSISQWNVAVGCWTTPSWPATGWYAGIVIMNRTKKLSLIYFILKSSNL